MYPTIFLHSRDKSLSWLPPSDQISRKAAIKIPSYVSHSCARFFIPSWAAGQDPDVCDGGTWQWEWWVVSQLSIYGGSRQSQSRMSGHVIGILLSSPFLWPYNMLPKWVFSKIENWALPIYRAQVHSKSMEPVHFYDRYTLKLDGLQPSYGNNVAELRHGSK